MQEFAAQFTKAWRVEQPLAAPGLARRPAPAGVCSRAPTTRTGSCAGLVDGQAALAFENARTLVDVERTMGLFFEPGLQAWAQKEEWIVTGANWMYVNSHFVITTTFLIWLYIARNQAYYYVRNMFMIAMGLALVGYLAYPTAPPRYMPEWGFTDTVATFVGDAAEQSANVLYNPFAAVPSMHVAFALMIGIPAIKTRQVARAEGRLGCSTRWSSRSWSSSPPTTSGSTPRSARWWPRSPRPAPPTRSAAPAPPPGPGSRRPAAKPSHESPQRDA